MTVHSATTIQAQWQVDASDDTRHDTRTVWATDAATALMVAREARGWSVVNSAASRISDWHRVHTFRVDTGGRPGTGIWMEPE